MLSARACSLQVVPPSLSALPSLRHLQISNNALTALPPHLKDAPVLEELYCCSNKIEAIPTEFGSGLGKLRVLQLDGNRIRSVPPAVLTGCTSLVLLSLYNNPIIIEELRDTPGYSAYNARRIGQVDKQLESRVSANLNEGADFTREQWL